MKGEKDTKRLSHMSLSPEIIRNANLHMNNNHSKMSPKLNNRFLVMSIFDNNLASFISCSKTFVALFIQKLQ